MSDTLKHIKTYPKSLWAQGSEFIQSHFNQHYRGNETKVAAHLFLSQCRSAKTAEPQKG